MMIQEARVLESEDITRNTLHWDDLRYFLALYRCKKLVAAGKALKVDHTTVGRRVRELETALDAKLFEKTDLGFRVTETGESLISYAEDIESALIGLQEKVKKHNHTDMQGLVRICAPDDFANYFLTPKLSSLMEMFPQLEIELIASRDGCEFARRDADVLITQQRPTNNRCVAKRLTRYGLGLYASASYIGKHPVIETIDDLSEHDFVSYVDMGQGDFAWDDKPLKNLFRKISLRSCNLMAQIQAVKNDYGVSLLPNFAVKNDPDLIQILPDSFFISRDYWLVVHEDMRDAPRLKKTFDYICNAVSEDHQDFQ